jgi:purine-binding chemotaxis protein CheW
MKNSKINNRCLADSNHRISKISIAKQIKNIWADNLRRSVMTLGLVSDQEQLVVFEVADESFGIDINAVQEIIRLQQITEVPRAPMHVKGVINLRGKVIPVVDLREKLGFMQGEETKSSRIVVVDIAGTTVGMIVDAVSEVLRISSEQIEEPSSIIESYEQYLRGIGKVENRLVLLLDLEKVLPEAAAMKVAA